jgi:myo-inositol-1(or 4)-monophosphatase
MSMPARIQEAAPPAGDLERVENLAIELANLAGAEIKSALGSIFTVRYKSGDTGSSLWRDPVSEVDHKVETIIRERIAEHFPDHGIIGEEMKAQPSRDSPFIWAVDPIDGTTNFINGFPLFAASIGVLHNARPVAGAVWCATSHALRAGVYHASEGGKLRFEGSDVTPKANPAVRSGLAGVPVIKAEDMLWETRKTGSAAIECAMVAAGLLRVARFSNPNIWDVAGGLALVRAAGGIVRQKSANTWLPMDQFEPIKGPDDKTGIRYWRRSIVIGTPDAVEKMCKTEPKAEPKDERKAEPTIRPAAKP